MQVDHHAVRSAPNTRISPRIRKRIRKRIRIEFARAGKWSHNQKISKRKINWRVNNTVRVKKHVVYPVTPLRSNKEAVEMNYPGHVKWFCSVCGWKSRGKKRSCRRCKKDEVEQLLSYHCTSSNEIGSAFNCSFNRMQACIRIGGGIKQGARRARLISSSSKSGEREQRERGSSRSNERI